MTISNFTIEKKNSREEIKRDKFKFFKEIKKFYLCNTILKILKKEN